MFCFRLDELACSGLDVSIKAVCNAESFLVEDWLIAVWFYYIKSLELSVDVYSISLPSFRGFKSILFAQTRTFLEKLPSDTLLTASSLSMVAEILESLVIRSINLTDTKAVLKGIEKSLNEFNAPGNLLAILVRNAYFAISKDWINKQAYKIQIIQDRLWIEQHGYQLYPEQKPYLELISSSLQGFLAISNANEKFFNQACDQLLIFFEKGIAVSQSNQGMDILLDQYDPISAVHQLLVLCHCYNLKTGKNLFIKIQNQLFAEQHVQQFENFALHTMLDDYSINFFLLLFKLAWINGEKLVDDALVNTLYFSINYFNIMFSYREFASANLECFFSDDLGLINKILMKSTSYFCFSKILETQELRKMKKSLLNLIKYSEAGALISQDAD